jgi:SAM-dependent methyltransferase
MDFKEYYLLNRTYITNIDKRLGKIIELVGKINPSSLLDIGCGEGYLLNELKIKYPRIQLSGIDVYEQSNKLNWNYKIADITEGLPFPDASFDCVILGEVIEHVPNPDFLLREIYRILATEGHIIVSTPNLVSWANRILVPLGIQPLFSETSSEINLGRYFKILGQGGKVQGHLKIFTHRSLEEILIHCNFRVIKKTGAPFFFPFPISIWDKFMSNFVSLASNLIYAGKK